MLATHISPLVVVVALAGACQGGSGPASGVDAGTPSVDGSSDGLQTFTCSAGPVSFAPADKSCVDVNDCAMVFHQTDCCGNSEAVGINASAVDAFTTSEAECSALFPGCGCPARPPQTEDGNAATPSQIRTECRDNLCRTKSVF